MTSLCILFIKRCLQKKKKPKTKKKPKEKTQKKYTITISHDLIDLIDLFYQNPFPYWSLKKTWSCILIPKIIWCLSKNIYF